MRLRLATMDDVPALEILIAASVRGLGGEYYNLEQIEAGLKYIFGIDTQLIDDQTYFVMEHGGEIAGCGGWSKRSTLYGGDQRKLDTTDDLLDPATNAARIRAFFVHPAWARRGIGRQIVAACETTAKSHGYSKIELVATLPGEPLYAALGYQVTRRIDMETPEGVSLPAAHMAKAFGKSEGVPEAPSLLIPGEPEGAH